MEEEKLISFPERHLEETVRNIGASLVGKVMKRFELSDNKDDIKLQIKELVYEEMRALKNVLYAYEKGTQINWNFKTK